jgi:two-component system sensor histidine kinase CpxA
MQRLFFKIFLWFWLAMAVVWSAFLIPTEFSRGDELRERFGALHDQRLIISGRVASVLARNPETFDQFKSELELEGAPYPFVFDDTGLEITGREVPAAAQDLALQVLASRSSDTVFVRDQAPVWGGLSFEREGLLYAVVQQIPSLLDYPVQPLWPLALRWVVLLLSSGLVCYAMARYLLGPVTTLSHATRALAQGDLEVRVGTQLGGRRDEISDLGEDFDYMAGRIGDLLRHQRQLLSDISHELRSPLARLSVALGLARQRAGEPAADSLQRIETESERLNAMIGELLTLTRLDDPGSLPPAASVDLGEVVAAVVADGDYEARGQGRRVEFEARAEALVRGYPELLTRAIENVVRNAIRYTPDDTAVTVTLDSGPGPNRATVRVTDKGPGVPPETLGSLFEPFYRVGDARDRASGGTGLGLSISERAVRAHGGSIRARNVPEGGLEIELSLPLDTASAQ